MRTYNYNDDKVFVSGYDDLHVKLKGYIQIPIYYGVDDDDTITLDLESMKEEFERTLTGIEITVDFIQDKQGESMIE